jgi:hypothetical protein
VPTLCQQEKISWKKIASGAILVAEKEKVDSVKFAVSSVAQQNRNRAIRA